MLNRAFAKAMQASTALCLVMAAPSFAQDQTFTLTVTDSDQPYQTPGYTFRVIPITITDPSGFRVDAVAQSGTTGGVSIVDFIIFTQGATIPSGAGTSFSTHSFDPNSVGFFYDGNPNGVDPFFTLAQGPAGPLTVAGDYQLVIAPYDNLGTAGDITVTFDLYGVFSSIFGPPGVPATDDLAEFLSASGGAARLIVVDAAGVARKVGTVSLSTRDAASLQQIRSGSQITASSKGMTGFPDGLYTWAELTAFRLDERDPGNAVVTGSGLAIGADVAIGPDMVAGLSLGYSDINATDTGTAQDGAYTYLQPYMAYRAGNWNGNASIIFGWGDYTQTTAGGTGSSDVELTALAFEGGYDLTYSDNMVITPTIGLVYGRETSDGTSGTLAGTTGVSEFTQASFGAVLTTTAPSGTYSFGAHLDWLDQDGSLALASQFIAEDGVTGRLELGAETSIGSGMSLASSVEVGGIGGNVNSLHGGVKFSLRF
ncbi:autotransporter outer membrane beta-barrel domain-containing protein [Paragemmobacter ruber]|uniref:Autotransporter domain-containing protein n=1 Tax=Paragemmobacter ruber TaxID=1985673 RepID=A0ABW9Y4P2_9RHOB|nr:autotransporter outer membrane beta-barrel domain-containing protein [Rhodobacter ruber]NBE06877.1 autotransporter domain-containing protein [Rhodobacter ruber]